MLNKKVFGDVLAIVNIPDYLTFLFCAPLIEILSYAFLTRMILIPRGQKLILGGGGKNLTLHI